MRRFLLGAQARLLYHLDQFVGWSPLFQMLALVALTLLLVGTWATILRLSGEVSTDSLWWSLTRFMDGGTMSGDSGDLRRLFAVGVSASGVLVVSLTIGAIASKLGERIQELRLGRSPVLVKEHILVLGFDAKVPLIARELARSHQPITMVTLATEDKQRQDLWLRAATQVAGSRLRVLARAGDPRSELALLRVHADRAKAVVVIAPSGLGDEEALRWTMSTLLALRRVTAPSCQARIIVEARRSAHVELLALAGEAGLAGSGALPIELIASDDILGRILAKSFRHGAIYLALRELLSFSGSELYLEAVPHDWLGKSFEAAHASLTDGVAVGVLKADGTVLLAPSLDQARAPLADGDRLIVIEADAGRCGFGGTLPAPRTDAELSPATPPAPQILAVLGSNPTLPRLIAELDRVVAPGSVLKLIAPSPEHDISAADERVLQNSRLERLPHEVDELTHGGAALAEVEGVLLLGCEDEQDPDGDASAIALLLQLRRARRSGEWPRLRRSVTEVRDPVLARQVAASLDDFLVSTDVVGMLIAHAAFDPELLPVYRQLLDVTGADIHVHPRHYYVPDGEVTFSEVMTAARQRGDVAIGYSPGVLGRPLSTLRSRVEGGLNDQEEEGLIALDPPRQAKLPDGPEARVIVLSRGP